MSTTQEVQQIGSKRMKDLKRTAQKLRDRIHPDEWRFAFHPFSDKSDIVGCFMWEYIRERPDFQKSDRAEFVYDLLESFLHLKFRRDFNLFYKGVPVRIIMALLNQPVELRPWLDLSNAERKAIMNTAMRPARVPVELEKDEIYRWGFKAPKSGTVLGNEADHAYWKYLIEQRNKDNPSGSRGSGRTFKSGLKELGLEDRDILISHLRRAGVLLQPDFLVNFLDYDPEELKHALSSWVDKEYPHALQIGQRRGAFKIRDLIAHLKRLAIMRLMNRLSIQQLQNEDLRRFDEGTDRDFYMDRKHAGKTFLKYVAREKSQEARSFPPFRRTRLK
jgi:hypothetical protein